MKNFFRFFTVVSVFVFVLGFYQYGNSNVVLTGTDKGVSNLKITYPYPPYTTNYNVPFAGTLKGSVDGCLTRFYCVDIAHGVQMNSDYGDVSSAKSKIIYIFQNYYPTKAYPYTNCLNSNEKEAAAIQFAVWWYSDCLDLNSINNSEIKTRAQQICSDADAHWNTCSYIKNLEVLQLSTSINPNHPDTLQVIVRNNDGTGRPNVTVTLSTTNGTLNVSTLTTGADGKTSKFFLTKGRDSVAVVKACVSNIPIHHGTTFECSGSSSSHYQRVSNGEHCSGSKCDKLIINWNCSGGGGGGVESNYDMAVALFQRVMKIRAGETTKILSNNTSVFSSQWQLQDFIPNAGPFNSQPTETTPFDILGISNATSAYACDYLSSDSRVGVVFSTTTNPPAIYSHQKQTCDRLVYGQLEDLQLVTIDNHQYYYGKIYRPQFGFTDNAVSFSVYQTSGGFVIDNKWSLDEYQVVNNATNVYNFQVWAPMFNSAQSIVEGIIAKFKTKGSVTYLNTQLKTPDVFVSEAKYVNDGKIQFTFKNLSGVNQNVAMRIVYAKQQGATEQTINQNINVDATGSDYTYPVGLISSARVYFTSQSGFKDIVFVGSGIYAYLTGANSTISSATLTQVSSLPNYPYGAFLFPGGINVKGTLNDEITITRSLDPAMYGTSLNSFDRLKFDATGTGKMRLFIESKIGNTLYHPYVELDLNGDKTFEIPLRTFKINGLPIDLSTITYAGFSMLKSNNPALPSVDFSIKNVAFYTNNDVANTTSPTSYNLYQNFPNPFNPVTFIKFDIPNATHVQIKVFDMLGRVVATVLDNDMTPTTGYEVAFDASALSSGIYFYRMITKDVQLTQKMVVLK